MRRHIRRPPREERSPERVSLEGGSRRLGAEEIEDHSGALGGDLPGRRALEERLAKRGDEVGMPFSKRAPRLFGYPVLEPAESMQELEDLSWYNMRP